MSARRLWRASVERWGVVWVALIVAGTLLTLAARGAGPLPGDLMLTRLVHRLPPDGVAGLLLFYPGDAVWFLPVVALAGALLGRRWSAALFVLLASVTGFLADDALKPSVARPPVELAREVPEGYGFPGGTALFAVVLAGAVSYLVLRERPPRGVAVATLGVSVVLILAVGLSRVYAGEHWATDVLGGWIFGGAWLLALVAAHRWWFNGRH